MGIGPRREAEPETVPLAAAAETGTWAAQQAFRLGAEQATRGYEAGFDVGHDVGYTGSADPGRRAFVYGVTAGVEAGNQARRELAEHLRALGSRPAGTAQREAETEAEAG